MMAPPKPQPAAPVHVGRVIECEWPTSEGRPWTFCRCETVPGKVYCDEHVRRARASSHEATPAAIANMVHRPKSTWTDARSLEEI